VSSPDLRQAPPPEQGTLNCAGARKALAGFFVSGVLLAFLGAILLSWQAHLSSEYSTVALYFLGLMTGVLGSVWISPPLLNRKGIGWTLSFACGCAAAGLAYLALVSPPFSPWWRVVGMAIIGCSAGVLHTAIFHSISPIYRHDPAATVNLAGILFGMGCLAVAVLVSNTFYTFTASVAQLCIAVIPALFAIGYARARFEPQQVFDHPSARALLSELRSPGAVLLSLLLFFQFGNEWTMAGWLPLFLTQRLGISPVTSLLMLALYWLALLVGRIVAQAILPRVSHARLLAGSVLASVFGCLVLLSTDNRFGAISGILLLGASFAPIYPLLVEKIGHRFPYYHPGHYNGIFSLAIAGGLLAPCALGFFASFWGIKAVMELPLAGSIIVFVLSLLISLEARLSESSRRASAAD